MVLTLRCLYLILQQLLQKKEAAMEPTSNHRRDLMSNLTKRTLPGFSFVSAGAPGSNSGKQMRAASSDCEGGCGGQCLSGCKDECITVSK
jgi:hypothetical protein